MPKNLEIPLLFDFYGEILTEKQRDVISLYYENDLSLSEIAENEGISRQGVRDSLKRAELQLTDMETRLGLARRFREMAEQIGQIRQAAEAIAEINERNAYSREIHTRAGEIIAAAERLSGM